LAGRDELNLAEFPIALLADRVPKGQKTLYFEDRHGRLTVTGTDAYGLPTAADADVIVAMIYLTKQRNNFRDVKVNFSRYELIKLLNWQDEGGSYKRLDLSFNRWGGVWLVYDKCWWDNKSKKHVSAKLHILESVVFGENLGRDRDRQANLPLSTFTWNQTFIESCQADNLRHLDLDTYFSLDSAVSKRLYRFLGKRFYLQSDYVFDLKEIAFDRVGLSRNYEHNAGKIKEKLQPAIDELEAVGFLRPLSRGDRYSQIDRGQWTIRLTAGPLGKKLRTTRQVAPLALPGQADVTELSAAGPQPSSLVAGPAEPPLARQLIDRGITAVIARKLVENFDAALIERQIEAFDWRVEKKHKHVQENPPGLLLRAIQNDYAAPKGFLPTAERQRQEDARQAKERQAAEDRRRQKEEVARERAEKKAIAAYWESLTAEQQAELDAAANAAADPEMMAMDEGPLKRIGQQLRRKGYIQQLLRNWEQVPAEA